MGAAVIEGCQAFGVGYEYTVCSGKTKEVQQGKNAYIASIFQAGELNTLCALITKVATHFFQRVPLGIQVFSNVASLVWFPMGLLLASIKHNQYTDVVDNFPRTLGRVLPRTLGERTTRILSWIPDHFSTCIKVAMFAGVAALTYFGSHVYVSVIAGTWFFHEMDIHGYLPRKVSILAETYLPIVSSACIVVAGGTLLMQGFAAVHLVTLIPFANQLMTYKVDALARYLLPKFSSAFATGPSLKEYEAPLIERKDLTLEEITKILHAKDEDYEINPAHCPKDFSNSLPKNYQFDLLHQMFNEIQWNKDVVKKKLKDDERFLDQKAEIFAQGSSNDDLFIHWMKGEFSTMIGTLKGEIRPKGEQKDLSVGIENCAMILSYLQQPSLGKIEQEDILLKLAVEAGGYCARGIKRASQEIVDETVARPPVLDVNSGGFQKIYEQKLKQGLQLQRRNMIQKWYQIITKGAPNALSQDVHGFDLYRTYLSLGFYPLSSQERKQISLPELFSWNVYGPIRQGMLEQYYGKLDSVIEGENLYFSNYMNQYIGSNEKLTQPQKDGLVDKLTDPDSKWGIQETNHRFLRVALVKLGILRPKMR